MLTFEPVEHVYHWNGRRVPSVTQCLGPLFDWSQVPPQVLERKRQIGVAIHTAIHLDLTGVLDPRSIDPACRPWWDAWCRFRDDMHFEPVLVEFRVVNTEIGAGFTYAGTLDEWGPLQGYPALIDWKTTLQLHTEAVGAQTAAYLKALVRMGFGSLHDRRFALKLGGNGRYKLEQFRRMDEDWARFASYRRQWEVAQWCECVCDGIGNTILRQTNGWKTQQSAATQAATIATAVQTSTQMITTATRFQHDET